MGYIRKVISDDEKLLVLTHPHWIYLLEGLFWFLTLTALGLLIDHYSRQYFGVNAVTFDIGFGPLHFGEKQNSFTLILMTMGLAIFFMLFFVYIGSEVGLTDRRIIYKRGILFIQTEQTELEDISAENVYHGLFGWLLKYGKIRLDCRFVDDMWLPAIREPYTFLKSSHNARLVNPGIEYHHNDFLRNAERIEREQRASRNYRLKNIIKVNFRRAGKR